MVENMMNSDFTKLEFCFTITICVNLAKLTLVLNFNFLFWKPYLRVIGLVKKNSMTVYV